MLLKLFSLYFADIQFAVETVKKKDHNVKMPSLDPEDVKVRWRVSLICNELSQVCPYRSPGLA